MRIEILDTNFQGMAQVTAVYLVIGPDGPVLIDTGPSSTIANITAELASHGFAPADIKHVLLTHIHLDHAGAAGWWAQQGAQIYVHPVGAPHLVDPSRLLASATRIYGDKMEQLWGQVIPIPEQKVSIVSDGAVVEVGGLSFTALNTPGHATHHYVYRLGEIGFTGDAAGVRLPKTGLISLPAPPPEFQLEVWLDTLRRLESERLETIYPGHFGPIVDVSDHLNAFRELLVESVAFIAKLHRQGADRETIFTAYVVWNRERAQLHGAADHELLQEELANPLAMSVDGILRYLVRSRK